MFNKFPTIEGSKVILKTFDLSHIDDEYISWLNDPIVVQYSNQRFRTHTRDSCVEYFNSFDGTNNYFNLIVSKLDGKAIGTMSIYVAEQHQTADVGIMIGARRAWGVGHGLDAWNRTLQWLFAELKIRKVTAGTLDCNSAMIKVMEKSGMQLEARRPKQELHNGVPHDLVYYGIFCE